MKVIWLKGIIKSEKGAVAVTVALMLTALVGFSALSIDIGYMMVTRNELQNVADASALGAANLIGDKYREMSYEEQQSYDCSTSALLSCTEIKTIAKEIGLENSAAQKNIVIPDADIEIGHWNATATPKFSPGTNHPNAVRITARRQEGINGPISTFLAGVIGINSVPVNAEAIAALTGQSTADPGDLTLPVGISRYWFDTPDYCDDTIAFSPTNSPESCAGWTSWEYNSNDANLRKILTEELESPTVLAGDSTFAFIGGDLSSPTFDDMESLFQKKGYDIDSAGNAITGADGEPLADATGTGKEVPLFEEDGVTPLTYPDGTARNDHRWATTIVVYDGDDCSNPNQDIKIVGFARVTISEVLNAPDKSIKGVVECNYVTPEKTRGGGGSYGTLGSISGLVQ